MEIGSAPLNLRKEADSYSKKFDGVDFESKADQFRKYVAWLSGDPAAASTLITDSGLAAIYDNAVQPYYSRGYGLDTATVYFPLKEAEQMGYKVGIVFCTLGQMQVFKGLGFEEVVKYSRYAYIPRIKPKRKSQR